MLSSTEIFELGIFLTSIVAGIVGSLFGLGGGVIIVPVLTLVFGIDIRYAIGASLISVIGTSSGAAAVFIKDRLTNVRVAMLLEVATTIGALTGATISAFIPTPLLFFIFSLLLFYSAYSMNKKKGSRGLAEQSADPLALKLQLNSSYPDSNLGKEISYTVQRVRLGLSLMFGAGILSGLLGIGSGALKVPAMDRAMKLPLKVSSATSNFMIGVTAAASAGTYYMRGDILPMVAAPVALGVLVGAAIGTRLMLRISSVRLRKYFTVILVLIAVQMTFRALGVTAK